MPDLKPALEDLIEDDLVKQTVINPLTNKIPILVPGTPDPVLKWVYPHQITQSVVVSGDPVPAGTEINVNAIPADEDGKIIPISGTADIEIFTINEGDSRIFEFQASGGKLVNSAGLPLPGGNDIVWTAGDRVEVYGVAGGVKVLGYTRASGVAVKPSYVRVFTIAPGPIDIANDLNHFDDLNGMTLEAGKDVLVPFQADAKQNGLWRVGATPVRTPGFESFDSFQGVLIDVTAGDVGEGTIWTITTKEGVIGTHDLEFGLVVGGYARADSLNNSQIHARPVVPKTSDHSVLVAEDRTIFTNVGASGTVKFTLPSNASCVPGKTTFKFVHLTNQYIQVEPASGNIYGYCDALGAEVNATNGSPTVSNAEIAAWIEVLYMGSDIWHAELNGRWS